MDAVCIHWCLTLYTEKRLQSPVVKHQQFTLQREKAVGKQPNI
jgi:hypothetical protein